jgi:hypothetical protein
MFNYINIKYNPPHYLLFWVNNGYLFIIPFVLPGVIGLYLKFFDFLNHAIQNILIFFVLGKVIDFFRVLFQIVKLELRPVYEIFLLSFAKVLGVLGTDPGWGLL